MLADKWGQGAGDQERGTGLDLYFVARLLRSWLHNVLADGKEGGDGRVTHLWVNRPPHTILAWTWVVRRGDF